jgi:diadenosine tetraphosphate (Ap4A) HIT family hydrolase
MDNFSKYIIKEYEYWIIYLHQNQGYLGRCVIWCKREDALDLSDATLEEQKELFAILNELKKAVQKAFQPDWLNYSFLGNETRHLHAHFIPRYAQPKIYEGITFKDELYGHNYRTDHNVSIPDEIIEKIRGNIKEAMEYI